MANLRHHRHWHYRLGAVDKSVDSMTPAIIDKLRSETNPWGLTAHQCLTIRLVCQHGGTKRAAHAETLPLRTLEHHLLMSRKAMEMYGSDVRLFLEFDRWTRQPVQAGKRPSRPAALLLTPAS